MPISVGPALRDEMGQKLSLTQLALLSGGILLMVGFFIFLIYALHKAFQRQRNKAPMNPVKPCPCDDAAFVTAAMQGVIARLKVREKELNDLLREVQQRAESSSQILEAVVRELPAGLMVFDRQGFLTLSNRGVHQLLGIDTWSRRRYPEILGPGSQMAIRIRECLKNGKSCRGESVACRAVNGESRTLSLSVSPCSNRRGQLQGAVCLLTRLN